MLNLLRLSYHHDHAVHHQYKYGSVMIDQYAQASVAFQVKRDALYIYIYIYDSTSILTKQTINK
jgi:hypothetical protein